MKTEITDIKGFLVIPFIHIEKKRWGYTLTLGWLGWIKLFSFMKDGWVEAKPNDNLEPDPINVDDMTQEEIDLWIKKVNSGE